VALLLCVSAAFAGMAYLSPVKSPPSVPLCSTVNNQYGDPEMTPACQAQVVEYRTALAAWSPWPTWWRQTYADVAEGSAVLALLFSLLTARRLDFSWLHKPLMSWLPKWLSIALALVGASIYIPLIILTSMWDTPFGHTAPFLVLWDTMWGIGPPISIMAIGAWGLAMLALSSRKGITWALKAFGLPAILYLTVMVLVFDSLEMTTPVTLLVSKLSLYGIDLVSNWLVLMVASFLFVYGLAYKKLGSR